MQIITKLLLTGTIIIQCLFVLSSCKKDDNGKNKEQEGDALTVSADVVILTEGNKIKIATNKDWTVQLIDPGNSSSWFEAIPMQGKRGNHDIALNKKDENNYSDERSALLKITAGNLTKYVTVIQRPIGSLIASRNIMEIPQSGGAFTVDINGSSNTKITIAQGEEWIAMNTQDINSTGKTSIRFNANAGIGRRGVIRVSDSNKRDSVIIYQSDTKGLTYIADTVDSYLQGGILYIDLKPNREYDVSLRNAPDWIRSFKTNTSRVDRRAFQIDPNKESILRSAVIDILDKTSMAVDSVCINQFFFDDIPFLYENDYGIYDYSGSEMISSLYIKYKSQLSQLWHNDMYAFRIYDVSNKQYCSFEDIPNSIPYGGNFKIRVMQNCLTEMDKNQLLNVTVIKMDDDKIWMYDLNKKAGAIIKRN